jgi:hypothetical protein
MSAQNRILLILEVCGGVAGATMILAGVLLLVSLLDATHGLVRFVIALLLVGAGLMLTFVRQLKRTRIVVGTMFSIVVVRFAAAVFLPNLFARLIV